MRRERRLELLLLVALHQIAVDVLRDVVVRRQVVIVRVERGDVRREPDRQVRGVRGQAEYRQQRGEQQVREAHRRLLAERSGHCNKSSPAAGWRQRRGPRARF